MFRVLPLGVGDAFAATQYSSCLALEADGSWLLVDCPHPIRKMMREASLSAGVELDVDRLAGCVLTHLHSDHCSGLEMLGFLSAIVLKRRMPLLAHPDISAHLWSGHLSAGMEHAVLPLTGERFVSRLEDFFDLMPLHFESAVQLGPFSVECRPARHSIPTTALRIRAAGRTLGCSADTVFDLDLIHWLAEADLVFHECGKGAVHTPYASLLTLPDEIRHKMRLIHYPDDFDTAASAIEALVAGRMYEV